MITGGKCCPGVVLLANLARKLSQQHVLLDGCAVAGLVAVHSHLFFCEVEDDGSANWVWTLAGRIGCWWYLTIKPFQSGVDHLQVAVAVYVCYPLHVPCWSMTGSSIPTCRTYLLVTDTHGEKQMLCAFSHYPVH